MKKQKITGKQIIIELILLALIGLSVCLFLSLSTYNSSDPGWSRTAWHYPVSNFGGLIGAYASDILFQFLGYIAFSLPVIIALICVQLVGYFYRHANEPINYFSVSFRIIGILAFVFSSTGFFALNISDPSEFEAGGYLGSIVIENLLPMMNNFILSLILLAVCFACVTLLTGLSWLYIIEKLGAFVMVLLTPVKWLLLSRRVNHVNQIDIEPKNQKLSQDQEPQITLSINSNSSQLDTMDDFQTNIGSKNSEPSLETSINKKSDNSTTSLAANDNEQLIKTAAELLQTLETSKQTQSSKKTSSKKNSNELNQSDILARMELILKNINEQQNQDQIIQTDGQDFQAKKLEITEPFEEDKYTITDAPIKPLFTLTHNANEIKPDSQIIAPHDEATKEISSFKEVVTPFTTKVENQNQFEVENQITPQSEDVDIDVLKQENPIIDDIYPEEVRLEETQVQTFALRENDNEEEENDEGESLIHPLLRRDDKPLPKPTTPLPSLNLLTAPPTARIEVDHAALNAMSELIEKSLSDYRVKAKVVDYMPGPVITRFEIELAPGIKAARISTLDRDLARSLSMPSVRVVEVIPGKPYVGIELPNKNRQTVYFREVLDSPQFRNAQSPLTVVLGKDISGQSVVADLAKMPHLLVAGTTGSGKSVGVNAMILSILYKSSPEDVRFIMIDPKMLELSIYEGIPHLLTQVVTDMKDAANALNWCVNEMEKRYRLMSVLGVRNIAGYNEKIKQAEEMGRPIPDPLWKPTDSMDLNMPTLEKLPYIVVMVDEFADLIMAVGKKVEELIARLAQKARAAGIHLVLATQRPSVDVITGLIKANIPTRIAFTVSSKIDSRTILDQMGAESLLGMGDMLYLAPNSSIPIRVHGAFVRDEEVHAVVQDWKARGTPKYIENVTVATDDGESVSSDSLDEELDPLFDQVVEFVVETRRASISSVQRKFRIGYNRAARIVEQMEVEGIISAPSHNGNREVLATSSHNDY